MSSFLTIRAVQDTPDDLGTLARFCNELAAFDGHQGSGTPEKLHASLFRDGTNVVAFLAHRYDEPVGFILAYECFTVYHGERGLYVPGAYVIPAYRHKGYGVHLFRHLKQYADANGFAYLNWIVEANNAKANAIYRKIGADISTGWSYVRLSKDAMARL